MALRAVVVDQRAHAVRLTELPVPRPSDDQVLVAVRASSVVEADVAMLTGSGSGGLEAAGPAVLGRDFAGVVERVGASVTNLVEGDEVFGCLPRTRPPGIGSWADYLAVSATGAVAHKPWAVGYLAAAALPSDGSLALAAVEASELGSSDRVLVVGASGGPGGYIVQLAARLCDEVIGCSGDGDRERVLALGASSVLSSGVGAVIEGTLSLHPGGVDRLIDLVSEADEFAVLTRLVHPGGRAVSRSAFAHGPASHPGVIVNEIDDAREEQLLPLLARLVDLGRVRSTMANIYGLDQAGEALGAVASGAPGKTVLLLPNGD